MRDPGTLLRNVAWALVVATTATIALVARDFHVPGMVLPFHWPLSGMALAFALGPALRRPAVAVAGYAALVFAVESSHRGPGVLELGLTTAHVVELLTAVALLAPTMRERTFISHPRSVLWRLIATAAAAAAAGAVVASGAITWLAPNPERPWTTEAWLFWTTHASNAVLLAPPLFAWLVLPSPRESWPLSRIAEAAALGAGIWFMSDLIFSPPPATAMFVPFPFGLLPLLLWAAVRFGLRGAGAAALAVLSVATTRSALGEGPFALTASPEAAVVQAHIFAAVLGTSAYLLAGILWERSLVSDALAGREEVFRRAEAASHVGSWRWDLPTGTEEWSDELHRIYGLSRETFDGKLETILETIVHPEDRGRVRAVTAQAAKEGRHIPAEYRIVRSDGSVRIVRREGGEVVHDAKGRPWRMFGTVQDVTEIRTAERAALQSSKVEALGAMAGGVAHDLNNTLTVILGHVSAAMEHLPAGSFASPHLGHALAGIRRASTLGASLLAYSGRGQVEVRRIDLASLVEDERRRLSGNLPTGVRLESPAPSGVEVTVDADPDQLRRLVRLLVENALEALTERGGIVALSVGQVTIDAEGAEFGRLLGGAIPPGRYARLEVRDDGSGMSAETGRRAFDPFFTTKTPGRGLGLAAVLGIVRGHHGGLRLTTAPGEGTRVEVVFPAAS